ncbi:MAG: carboxypeptidase regulatory-like domain-containing protein [Candidatus Marinimicrobia bacterium]|nr:carboxypeptidase regulatory-like domain-containing protein [Candidatus Neomarinimicrobiota bacterium]
MSVDPSETYTGEPVTISISGDNFHPSAVPYIAGTESPDHLWVDSTLIRCLTPASLSIGTHNVKVVNADGQYDLLVDAFTVNPHTTTLSGYVTDASNAQPVEGAVVTLATVSDTTDSEGYYHLSDVPAGELTAEFMATPTSGEVPLTVNFMDLSTSNTQTVTAAATGYIDYLNTQVPVTANEDNILNFSLSPEIGEGEMRFVLTWDDDPADLDSHPKTPPIDGSSYHVYYAAKGDSLNPPFARLDVDDVTGYGPETITLYETFDGTYHYYIYKFSGYEEITQSNAVVNIYDNTRDFCRPCRFRRPEAAVSGISVRSTVSANNSH